MFKNVTMKRGKYNCYMPERIQKIIVNVCELYESGEYTIESCCKSVGVSYRTFANWFNKYENFGENVPEEWKYFAEFAEMYRMTKIGVNKIQREILISKAKTALEKKITGYEYEVKITEVQKQIDQYGNEILVPFKRKIISKYTPPSVRAIEFVLKKLKPEEYGETSAIISFNPNKNKYNEMTIEEIESEITKLESNK